MLRRWFRRWLGLDALEREMARLRAADLNSLLPDADRLTLAQLEDRVRALEAQADAR